MIVEARAADGAALWTQKAECEQASESGEMKKRQQMKEKSLSYSSRRRRCRLLGLHAEHSRTGTHSTLFSRLLTNLLLLVFLSFLMHS